MEVDCQIQRTAESLKQGDGTGVSRAVHQPSFINQMHGDVTVDDAMYPAHQGRVAGKLEPQRKWEAKQSLA